MGDHSWELCRAEGRGPLPAAPTPRVRHDEGLLGAGAPFLVGPLWRDAYLQALPPSIPQERVGRNGTAGEPRTPPRATSGNDENARHPTSSLPKRRGLPRRAGFAVQTLHSSVLGQAQRCGGRGIGAAYMLTHSTRLFFSSSLTPLRPIEIAEK